MHDDLNCENYICKVFFFHYHQITNQLINQSTFVYNNSMHHHRNKKSPANVWCIIKIINLPECNILLSFFQKEIKYHASFFFFPSIECKYPTNNRSKFLRWPTWPLDIECCSFVVFVLLNIDTRYSKQDS